MKNTFAASVAVFVLSAMLGTCHAGTIGITAFLGYHTYSLSGINEGIRSPSLLLPGTTVAIDNGIGFGAGVRYTPTPRVLIGLDLSCLLASAEGTGTFVGQSYDWSMDIPANVVAMTIGYYPWARRTRIGIGGGFGYYVADGEVKSKTNVETTSQIKGHGIGAHALVLGELPLSSRFAVEWSAGYRWARTSDSEIRLPLETEHHDYSIDWSGLMTRTGLRFNLR